MQINLLSVDIFQILISILVIVYTSIQARYDYLYLVLSCVIMIVTILVQVTLFLKYRKIQSYKLLIAIIQIVISLQVAVKFSGIVFALQIKTFNILMVQNLKIERKILASIWTLCCLYTVLTIRTSLSLDITIMFALIQLFEIAFIFLKREDEQDLLIQAKQILSNQNQLQSFQQLTPTLKEIQQQGNFPAYTQIMLQKDGPDSQIELKKLDPIVYKVQNNNEEKQFQIQVQEIILDILPIGMIYLGSATDTPLFKINEQDKKSRSTFQIWNSNLTARQMFGVETNRQLEHELGIIDDLQKVDILTNNHPSQKSIASYVSFISLFQQQQRNSLNQQIQSLLQGGFEEEYKRDHFIKQSFDNGSLKEYLQGSWEYLQQKISKNAEILGLFQIKRIINNQAVQINQKIEYSVLEIQILGVLVDQYPVIVLQCRDISHRTYINSVKQQSNYKTDTLAYVSHEYRNALNLIIHNLEFALGGEMNQTSMSYYIKVSLEYSKSTLNLSNDLLDLAMIRAGQFRVTKKTFNLYNLIQDCKDMFQIQAQKNQILVEIDYDTRVPREFTSDPKRITQVLINLITNAFKFTLVGYITLRVQWKNDDVIIISVDDTGIGLRKEDQQKLGNAFITINDKQNQNLNSQGIGLGLVISNLIVSSICPSYNQGLKFESEFKKGFSLQYQIGSRFWFELKNMVEIKEISSGEDSGSAVSSDDQCSISESRSQSLIQNIQILKFQKNNSPQSLRKRKHRSSCLCSKILIVDDDRFNIEVLSSLLGKMSITNIEFTISGTLAIEKVEARVNDRACRECQSYRLIFMDSEMPGLSGRDTAKKILRILNQQRIKTSIIACSGYTDLLEKQLCMAAGMVGYLVKPINYLELQDVIRKFY